MYKCGRADLTGRAVRYDLSNKSTPLRKLRRALHIAARRFAQRYDAAKGKRCFANMPLLRGASAKRQQAFFVDPD